MGSIGSLAAISKRSSDVSISLSNERAICLHALSDTAKRRKPIGLCTTLAKPTDAALFSWVIIHRDIDPAPRTLITPLGKNERNR